MTTTTTQGTSLCHHMLDCGYTPIQSGVLTDAYLTSSIGQARKLAGNMVPPLDAEKLDKDFADWERGRG